MADTKIKRHSFTTPKGVFVFPKLEAPDTKFKTEGEYSVKLRLHADRSETQALIANLSPLHADAVKAGKKAFDALPVASRKKLEAKGGFTTNGLFTPVYDKETEEPTGEIEFKFGMKASGVTKFGPKKGKTWKRKPTLFDAKGKIMQVIPSIWGGTVGKVSFTVAEGGYFIPGTGACGLTLSLEAAQIIELISGGERNAAAHGFEEEDGYEASDAPAKAEDDDAPFNDESADAAGGGESSEDGDF